MRAWLLRSLLLVWLLLAGCKMGTPLNLVCHTLPEAVLTLYPANADGTPQLDKAVWLGVEVNGLSIRDRWIKVETRPSGARFPRQHPLVPQYEISIERVWALPLAQLDGFIPTNSRYVLDIVWTEEDTRDWHREVYYGVTISERSRESRDRDGEFIEHQVFDAEYFVPSSGLGVITEIPGLLPFTVRWVSANENAVLYRYDLITDFSAGEISTVGRATLAYNPGNKTGSFDLTFSGEQWPALQVTNGKLEVMAFIEGPPSPSDLPRVEFYYGPSRLASITRTGRLYASRFLEESILPVDLPHIKLFASSTLQCVLRPDGVHSKAFHAFAPTDITGLKLWLAVEDLMGHEVPVADALSFDVWPDRSGNEDVTIAGGDVFYLPTGGEFITPKPDKDGKPAVYLFSDTAAELRTVGPVVSTGAICAFVVAKPGRRDGVSGAASMNLLGARAGGTSDDGSWFMQLADFKLQGNIYIDGDVLNTVNGTKELNNQFVENSRWYLLEQETVTAALNIRVNGQLEGTYGINLVDFVGASYPLCIGGIFGADPAMALPYNGMIRSVVVFEATLTTAQKAKVRQYLRNAYPIY